MNQRSLDPRFLDAVALGEYPGWSIIHKFGFNANCGAAMQDIRPEGGIFEWPQTPFPVVAESDAAADNPAGLGARTIVVQGVDDEFNEVEAEIPTNGLAAGTQSVMGVYRVNRCFCNDCGTYANTIDGSNVGNITVRHAGGANLELARISQDNRRGQTEIGAFSVPKGKQALILTGSMCVDSQMKATLYLWSRDRADVTSAPFGARRERKSYPGISGYRPIPGVAALRFGEKTDIWWSADSALPGTPIGVNFELLVAPARAVIA